MKALEPEQREKLSRDFCDVSLVHGFKGLFGSPPDVEGKAQQESKQDFLKFGTKLLISGAPGAGKTTFALSLIRAMMAKAAEKPGTGRTIAYYISAEVDRNHLTESFSGFGWFGDKERDREQTAKVRHTHEAKVPFIFRLDHPQPDETNFYAITPLPEVDRPVPSPEELVNGIFSRIVHTLLPSEAPTANDKVYIVIDSITALLKGCPNAGEERRQTHEIIKRLQDKFEPSNLAMIVLLAEQDHRSSDDGITSAPITPTEPSVEDYLADMVFRLYVRSMPLGRRARILEVVKSQGEDMTLGEHTWQIISSANAHLIIRHEDFSRSVCEMARCRYPGPWGTIAIFPRPRLSRRNRIVSESEFIHTGTRNLQLRPKKGSITLIAGPMGCNKTALCTNFLRCYNDNELLPDSTEKNSQDYREMRKKRVLISFDAPNDLDLPSHPYRSLSFTQSQFDLNILVAHINFILEQKCERLVFDGLSEWITMFDKPEAARVLEALMITVKRCSDKNDSPPTVFMTYEMPLGDDPLGPSALGTTADNIIVVRPVAVNDRFRKVIYALKYDGRAADLSDLGEGEGLPSPEHPGELVWSKDKDNAKGRLIVDLHSMESYTGLLSSRGEVGPARVLLQLFSENDHEELQNQLQVRSIKDQFKKRIDFTVTNFGISDIGSTLESALSVGKPGDHFNLSIHSVDEWWLRSTKVREFLRNLKTDDVQPDKPRLRHEDFWWFEVEKAKKLPWRDAGKTEYYAVPGYLDFGMFCINIGALSSDYYGELMKSVGGSEDPLKEPSPRLVWQRILNGVPRYWVKRTQSWFSIDPGNTSENSWSLLEFALVASGQKERPMMMRKAVFTFDSSTRETCSCMLLELAWAFGGSETLFSKAESERNSEALRTAFRFLQFMVLEGLMLARSHTNSENHGGRPILFSRRWYSSLHGVIKRQRTEEGELLNKLLENDSDHSAKKLNLVAIPFMPSGFSDSETMVDDLLRDITVRQVHWLDRATEFIKAHRLEGRLGELRESLFQTCVKLQKAIALPDSKGAAKTKVNFVLAAYRESRSLLLEAAEIVTNDKADWAPGLDDLMELATWASIRLQFLLGAAAGRFPVSLKESPARPPAGDTLYHARWVRHYLPDLGDVEEFEPANTVGTGYVCTGAWMYGVGANSRSATIQTQVLSELTSLKGSIERANLGAGIPARKDFFYLQGEQAVTGARYMNWRELLRFGGARARRRDRVFLEPPSAVPREDKSAGSDGSLTPTKIFADPSKLYNVIYQEMLACLRIADIHRSDYSLGGQAQKEAISAVSVRADAAVTAIYQAISYEAESRGDVTCGENLA